MKKMTLAMTVIAGLIGASAACAADINIDEGVYIVGGVGRSISGDSGKSSVDDLVQLAGGKKFTSEMGKPVLGKLEIGYQLNQYLSLEGGYIGSKKESYTASGGNLASPVNATPRFAGWNGTIVGSWPVSNRFSLLAKVGAAQMQELATIRTTGFVDSTTGAKGALTNGVGVKYNFNKSTFLRFDVDRYNIGTTTASRFSIIGVLEAGYKF